MMSFTPHRSSPTMAGLGDDLEGLPGMRTETTGLQLGKSIPELFGHSMEGIRLERVLGIVRRRVAMDVALIFSVQRREVQEG